MYESAYRFIRGDVEIAEGCSSRDTSRESYHLPLSDLHVCLCALTMWREKESERVTFANETPSRSSVAFPVLPNAKLAKAFQIDV